MERGNRCFFSFLEIDRVEVCSNGQLHVPDENDLAKVGDSDEVHVMDEKGDPCSPSKEKAKLIPSEHPPDLSDLAISDDDHDDKSDEGPDSTDDSLQDVLIGHVEEALGVGLLSPIGGVRDPYEPPLGKVLNGLVDEEVAVPACGTSHKIHPCEQVPNGVVHQEVECHHPHGGEPTDPSQMVFEWKGEISQDRDSNRRNGGTGRAASDND